MNLKNSFDITVSERLIQRFEKAREVSLHNFNSFTDKVQQVATQNTENAIDTFNHTKENFENSIPQVSIQNVVSSSVTDWFEQHPGFLGIIKSLNWAANHPIISVIIFIFGLAFLWSLIKAIGRLIEKASLSILQIPLKLFGSLVKYIWLSLNKFKNFAIQRKYNKQAILNNSDLQLHNNSSFQVIPDNNQQRLKEISIRLEQIQLEQQQLLQEAANILEHKTTNK